MNDPREHKVDLGVGVYRDAVGSTPVLQAVKTAEAEILSRQASKTYLGTAGRASFNGRMQDLVLGDSQDEDRTFTVQTPGGSGALRLAAEILAMSSDQATLWIPGVTWSNHVPLLSQSGAVPKTYPLYDAGKNKLTLDAMLETIESIPTGDCIVLHACCHNPTGQDPSDEQWRQIVDALARREITPLFDLAYLGFAAGVEEDAFAIRYAAAKLPELLIATSCSKNFGLYRDRVGALTVVTQDKKTRDAVASLASAAARTSYSMPPDHGAAVVDLILEDAALRKQWLEQLGQMRNRLHDMRALLCQSLVNQDVSLEVDHLRTANGMFCLIGISPEQVDQLKTGFGVYMATTSRINLAGLTASNVEYVAESIASVV